MQEVAENDYNLNIPRYVDTFEEEEPIDIKAVMAEIKELEAKRAELDKEIEVYLKELGLVVRMMVGTNIGVHATCTLPWAIRLIGNSKES